ncbi:YchJ family protein [Flavobacterium branchiophilum]|uniref:Preprotein translocase subunit SecA n=1 Tax=Flavobacterium branchiophilum TaxID=55197 RepID=A0A2H3KCG0_9FLAO|nr:YchJ family metal-binding protein [Flavobacterium branchiophilum]PDS25042.1 preprotein translocase subunit SecA [Flavobacterium branchiophilum]
MEKCPCGLPNSYETCCGVFHNSFKHAPTAALLMRSRYAAYVLGKIDYLWETTHVSTRHFHDKVSMKQWAEQSTWLQLQILEVGTQKVRFKAFYLDEKGQNQTHHEASNFVYEAGKWYYVDGIFL